jgi:hypothetical protein
MDDMNDMSELQSLLDGAAQELTGMTVDPVMWRNGMIYLMKVLESQSQDREAFESMLANLCDDLAIRLDAARWPW